MFHTFVPLAIAARLEADYQLWLQATQQEGWYPTASRSHFIMSRLGDFTHMELRTRHIDSKKARWGFPSKVEAGEYKRRHGTVGEVVKEGRLYFIRP